MFFFSDRVTDTNLYCNWSGLFLLELAWNQHLTEYHRKWIELEGAFISKTQGHKNSQERKWGKVEKGLYCHDKAWNKNIRYRHCLYFRTLWMNGEWGWTGINVYPFIGINGGWMEDSSPFIPGWMGKRKSPFIPIPIHPSCPAIFHYLRIFHLWFGWLHCSFKSRIVIEWKWEN